jgi:dolichol kinase
MFSQDLKNKFKAKRSSSSAASPDENSLTKNHSHHATTVEDSVSNDDLKACDESALKSRKDIHLGRRIFHLCNGVIVATAYQFLFTHQQAVYLLGTIACLIYVFDHTRIAYPDLLNRTPWLTRLFMRAEEQFRESAMIPYVMAILLSIITFPKQIALIAILTLAIADPLAAIIGIRFGKRHWVSQKTVEGSIAFFLVAFCCSFGVLYSVAPQQIWAITGASLLTSIVVSGFEMLPIKIDDNLTIPLITGFTAWLFISLFSVAYW